MPDDDYSADPSVHLFPVNDDASAYYEIPEYIVKNIIYNLGKLELDATIRTISETIEIAVEQALDTSPFLAGARGAPPA